MKLTKNALENAWYLFLIRNIVIPNEYIVRLEIFNYPPKSNPKAISSK